MTEAVDDSDDSRRGIQSVDVGLRVLEALAAAPGAMSLKALAAASAMPASNCHRYCVSFVRAGWMTQDAGSGRYALGHRLIAAGLTALGRADPVGAATQALEQLVDETGHTGQLAVWADAGPVIVRWMPGRMAVRTSLTAGAVLPLLTSATGRVFLAFLPERQTAALAAREAMSGGGDPAALADQVLSVGLARVSGDHIPGLSAVAAPVLDAYGEAAAVMTLVAARQGFSPSAAERLRTAAKSASRSLGWTDAGRTGAA